MTMLIKSSFSKLKTVDFLAQAEGIITAMTGNANFPDPWPATVPTLTQIQADTTALQGLATATAAGDRTQVRNRNTARSKLADDLVQLALYLQSAAQGDPDKLATTGFPLRPVPRRTKNLSPPDAPGPIKLSRGPFSGTLVVQATRVPKAAAYDVQTATADPTVESNWNDAGSFKNGRRMQVQGLTPGKYYAVRVRALGSAGYGPWATGPSMMVV